MYNTEATRQIVPERFQILAKISWLPKQNGVQNEN